MSERRLVSSGSPYEAVAGFSRAVRVGDHVHVAGTAPVMPDGSPPPPDAYGQARRCFEIILQALAQAGARPEHVVRTRIYAVHREDFENIARAHAEFFGVVKPATTYVVVTLLHPQWRVEIEADAIVS